MIRMSFVKISVLKNIYTFIYNKVGDVYCEWTLCTSMKVQGKSRTVCEISGYVKIAAGSNVERELLSATWKCMCVWSS